MTLMDTLELHPIEGPIVNMARVGEEWYPARRFKYEYETGQALPLDVIVCHIDDPTQSLERLAECIETKHAILKPWSEVYPDDPFTP